MICDKCWAEVLHLDIKISELTNENEKLKNKVEALEERKREAIYHIEKAQAELEK